MPITFANCRIENVGTLVVSTIPLDMTAKCNACGHSERYAGVTKAYGGIACPKCNGTNIDLSMGPLPESGLVNQNADGSFRVERA